ncbi:MAG: hypothetical protein CBB72_011350 [Muricauda sp. TMED12]|nr:MAG: hypothetical protein CBB72_011350 [Muricauda sp. TMED12]
MAITKRTEQDKIEIVGEFKTIQVRTATVIEEDGVELSRSFHRHTVNPDISTTDLANESTEVQAICNAVHTQTIKDNYTAHLAAITSET